jgi:DNA-binding LytR/AlgR family response regulator
VFLSGQLVGSLITFGASDGDRLASSEAPTRSWTPAQRLVAMRGSRMVLLRSSEVYFAESDGNDVWLATEQGRLRAATQGMDKVDAELAEAGFLRVHRRYVVNVDRIREVERGFKGEMLLVMDGQAKNMVPVSRRNAATVRRALGI